MANGNQKNNSNKSMISIPIIIFGFIFLYLIICVVVYLRTDHVVRYEVKEGTLTVDKVYTAVVLRDEQVVPVQAGGYINYLAREGERISKNSLIYIVDETGKLNDTLSSMSQDESSFSNAELEGFKNEIVAFVHQYDSKSFDSVYEYKYIIKNEVFKLANQNMLTSISALNGIQGVSYAASVDTGIVSYWYDGYEDLIAENVTEAIFDESTYTKKSLTNNELKEVGEPAYKLSKNENWSIVIPIDQARGRELLEQGYIKVRFAKNQYESWGKVTLLNNADGNTYLKLDFTNSMITFVNTRFLEVELIVDDEMGLKIPVSSIAHKEFFLIPEAFIELNDSNQTANIYRQCYLSDGNVSTEALTIELYNFDSESREYYVDSMLLNAGDVLCKMEGMERFTVSKRATLTGVYNMNKGYADFKRINILTQNEEYAIVKSNTTFGLSVYDYIVLDAKSVTSDQFVQ